MKKAQDQNAPSVTARAAPTAPAPETSISGAGPAPTTRVAGSFDAVPEQQPQLQQPQQDLVPQQQQQLMPPAPPQPAAPARAQAAPAPAPAPAARQARPPVRVAQAPREAQRPAVCATCGTVESVQPVKEKGKGTGIGVAGGAVTGGLLGHQMGGGSGKTALTVLGALGGAFAGNEVEQRVRATTAYDVQVRMEDGSVRTLRRSTPIAAGTQVQVEGNTLRIAQRPATTRQRDLASGG